MSKILLERQTCVLTERVGTTEVYVVVKQTNFLLCLTSTDPIENADVSCDLLYDMPDLKAVPYVAQKPITFRSQQVSPEAINVECKLNVLSSQHEDMLFRIRVVVSDKGKPVGEVISNPIRSTSKIDTNKKTRQFSKYNGQLTTVQAMTTPAQLKKPKKNDILAPAVTQRRVFELALLSSNTILLERLRQANRREEQKVTTVDAGVQQVCEKMASMEYTQLQMNLMNTLGGLDQEQSNALFEICSVIQSMYPQQYTFQPVVEQKFTPFGEFNGNYSGQPNVFGGF
ncbi:hypothetical protein EIN_475790 [Entamoeba invadens IP1]|uniref:Uncharacterized protein n=1 Tax=Entamoeba invadens IP1 TaxID=370355 RepID=A0A0A1U789_ENTIV|nr:hypothetical protein EIN_475790 [Entamoeba invadens IP1]ELP88877.1 hypothetical protein EIN_475790 [Entamoeba invadens IP1]|eukprot:XP_004255648.1 hypothetical protein EIN_475790 [Entamoeba invadens IP1]